MPEPLRLRDATAMALDGSCAVLEDERPLYDAFVVARQLARADEFARAGEDALALRQLRVAERGARESGLTAVADLIGHAIELAIAADPGLDEEERRTP